MSLNVNKASPAVQYVWLGWHWAEGDPSCPPPSPGLGERGPQAANCTQFSAPGFREVGYYIRLEKIGLD